MTKRKVCHGMARRRKGPQVRETSSGANAARGDGAATSATAVPNELSVQRQKTGVSLWDLFRRVLAQFVIGGCFLLMMLTLYNGWVMWTTSFTPPGHLYAIQPKQGVSEHPFSLHLHCVGQNLHFSLDTEDGEEEEKKHVQGDGEESLYPTVVLDHSIMTMAQEYHALMALSRLQQRTRVCLYDRAGYGFSEESPLPRTAENEAEELRALLQAAGEEGPFILVGHSRGGLNALTFAANYGRWYQRNEAANYHHNNNNNKKGWLEEEVVGVIVMDMLAPNVTIPLHLKKMEGYVGWALKAAPVFARLGLVRFFQGLSWAYHNIYQWGTSFDGTLLSSTTEDKKEEKEVARKKATPSQIALDRLLQEEQKWKKHQTPTYDSATEVRVVRQAKNSEDELMRPLYADEDMGFVGWVQCRPEYWKMVEGEFLAEEKSLRDLEGRIEEHRAKTKNNPMQHPSQDTTAIPVWDFPLTVISAGRFPSFMANFVDEWVLGQRELAALSRRGTFILALDNDHNIPSGHPSLLLDAILEMMNRVANNVR
ncbi:Alpha/beta hydrolase [Balamuthia mandrillaris]